MKTFAGVRRSSNNTGHFSPKLREVRSIVTDVLRRQIAQKLLDPIIILCDIGFHKIFSKHVRTKSSSRSGKLSLLFQSYYRVHYKYMVFLFVDVTDRIDI